MKKRLSIEDRTHAQRQRLQALKRGNKYASVIYRERKKELVKAIESLQNIPYDKWLSSAPSLLQGEYMKKIVPDMYLTVGVPAAREAVNDFFQRKNDNDFWYQRFLQFVETRAGKKVTTINDSYRDWFLDQLRDVMNESGSSVEVMTQALFEKIIDNYKDVMEWQVRRIVQTETLSALSYAQSESIKALDIPFLKVWGISGNNTRPAHEVMDGVAVDDTELFIVGGEEMEFPRDDSFGASAENIINCSCFVQRVPK